jgi:hypothetical protein
MSDTESQAHYDESTLRAYLADALPEEVCDAINAHLYGRNGCMTCRARARAIDTGDADGAADESALGDAFALLDTLTAEAHGEAYEQHVRATIEALLASLPPADPTAPSASSRPASTAIASVPPEPASEFVPLVWKGDSPTDLTLEFAYAGPDEPPPPEAGLNAGWVPVRSFGQALVARLKGERATGGAEVSGAGEPSGAPAPSPGSVILVPLGGAGEPAVDRAVQKPLIKELFTGDWIARFTNIVAGEYVLVFRPG